MRTIAVQTTSGFQKLPSSTIQGFFKLLTFSSTADLHATNSMRAQNTESNIVFQFSTALQNTLAQSFAANRFRCNSKYKNHEPCRFAAVMVTRPFAKQK